MHRLPDVSFASPQAQDITPMHVYNWIAQIAFDVAIYHFFGESGAPS